MRLLLDACMSRAALQFLLGAGHDVEWAGAWPEDPGDDEILRRADTAGRILVTLDKDFGELAIVHGRKHRGILRIVGFSSTQQGPAIEATLARHAPDLDAGGIVTVERTRVRVRGGPGEMP